MAGSLIAPVVGAAAGKLLGGGDDGGGAPVSQITLPQYLQDAIESNVGRADEVFGREFEAYNGQDAIAGLSQDETDAFSQLRNQMGGSDLYNTQAQDIYGRLVDRAEGPTGDQLSGLMNPYQQGVTDIVKRDAVDDYAVQRQNIEDNAANIGAFGGSRQAILESEAMKNLNTNLSDIQTQGLNNNYNQAIGQFNQGSGILSSTAGDIYNTGLSNQQQSLSETSALANAGSVQRGIDQGIADVDYNEFQTGRTWDQDQVGGLQNILSSASGSYGGNTTTYTPQGSSDNANMLGGAAMGASIYQNQDTNGLGNVLSSAKSIFGFKEGGLVTADGSKMSEETLLKASEELGMSVEEVKEYFNSMDSDSTSGFQGGYVKPTQKPMSLDSLSSSSAFDELYGQMNNNARNEPLPLGFENMSREELSLMASDGSFNTPKLKPENMYKEGGQVEGQGALMDLYNLADEYSGKFNSGFESAGSSIMEGLKTISSPLRMPNALDSNTLTPAVSQEQPQLPQPSSNDLVSIARGEGVSVPTRPQREQSISQMVDSEISNKVMEEPFNPNEPQAPSNKPLGSNFDNIINDPLFQMGMAMMGKGSTSEALQAGMGTYRDIQANKAKGAKEKEDRQYEMQKRQLEMEELKLKDDLIKSQIGKNNYRKPVFGPKDNTAITQKDKLKMAVALVSANPQKSIGEALSEVDNTLGTAPTAGSVGSKKTQSTEEANNLAAQLLR